LYIQILLRKLIYHRYHAGFGSTYPWKIEANGIHYDCGCIISEDGDLLLSYSREHYSVLNVPAVYVAYFSTFGAIVCLIQHVYCPSLIVFFSFLF
jgi:hypothetical protein